MRLLYQVLFSFMLFLFSHLLNNSSCSPQGNLIDRWANRLGKDLWDLGQTITSKGYVENSYKLVNVEAKDPQQIIEEIVGNVSYMMKKKMDAVNCIIDKAQKLAAEYVLEDVNYTYYISNRPDIYQSDIEPPDPTMYRNMTSNNDTHFFDLAVNTNYSSVHVPTNVYHKHAEAATAIRWSEYLDETFTQNYEADPALSWQYFGSSTGIMRHFPAMEWGSQDKGLFDCRIRTWFIEAATCTKDVVILMDNSGSMQGMSKHIASLVVNTILDTLSNNDYVNVMNYSETVDYMVPCFQNQIVQATEENIVIFKDFLKTLEPENKSFLDTALIEAFELLHKYRRIRGCHGTSKYCNQAIMLVTDGIPNNVSDVINQYNRIENESTVPIRIFTFLVGKEASHLTDSIWIACSNRGFHSHVDALEQVTASVYKYIMVFARPLVLNGSNPLSWTHAYLDDTFEFGNKSSRGSEKYRLLTTVAGPVLDLREEERTKSAKLLGVAGTDVPVAEISKLMYLYKTGVNSHSFIVSNNGYVLKHPDLRPMFKDILTNNYNSIDLTEVEQLDDDTGPRDPGDMLLQLRNATVKGEEGVIQNVKIKYHYDDMRRVSREINDYFYAPIQGTPFSIGFAIPDLYGNYSIEVTDEIALRKFSSQPISDFFSGSNWKIHPHWVYCKYHYLEGHEFDTPEKELIHFINKMKSNDFKWSLQYEDDKEQEHNNECGNDKTLGKDDYYCDRNLVKHVVFDARVTKPTFDASWRTQTTAANNLRLLYNATLRFVATMSGLTRWDYIGIQPNGTKPFGDLHPRAIGETWYKSAVIQHRYNDRSFVYSVPFDSQEDNDLLVTASSAIFPEQNGIAAPAAVVGFQFSHSHLKNQFFNLTTLFHMCKGCLPCETEESDEAGLKCYIIDHSGYIVVSKKKADAGVFFGEIDGNIMNATIEEGIFEKVTVRDYQAICYYDAWISGDSSILTTPFNHLMKGAKWILSQIIWLTIKLNLNPLWDSNSWLIDAAEQTPTKYKSTATTKPKHKKKKDEEERWHEFNQIPQYKKEHAACEKERDLYVLQQQMFTDNLYPRLVTPRLPSCFRPFYLKKIPHSNLLLIAITNQEKPKNCPIIVHNTRLRDIVYENDTDFPCQKLYLNKLYRQPLQGCFNDHPLEQTIIDCGRSGRIHYSINLVITSLLLLIRL